MTTQRARARLHLGTRLQTIVGEAPMTFIADPTVPQIAAELLIRDLLDLGWTPPPEEDAPPAQDPAAAALRAAADTLARLQYVRPNEPGRPEYERMLAIRRGNTDAWLRERADQITQDVRPFTNAEYDGGRTPGDTKP